MATYRTMQNPMTQTCSASTLIITNEGLTITIARRIWTPRLWNALVALLLSWGVQGLAWVGAPSWIPSRPGQPRWKRIACDGLTRLLFALLIPPTHWLRPLFDAYA